MPEHNYRAIGEPSCGNCKSFRDWHCYHPERSTFEHYSPHYGSMGTTMVHDPHTVASNAAIFAICDLHEHTDHEHADRPLKVYRDLEAERERANA